MEGRKKEILCLALGFIIVGALVIWIKVAAEKKLDMTVLPSAYIGNGNCGMGIGQHTLEEYEYCLRWMAVIKTELAQENADKKSKTFTFEEAQEFEE